MMQYELTDTLFDPNPGRGQDKPAWTACPPPLDKGNQTECWMKTCQFD